MVGDILLKAVSWLLIALEAFTRHERAWHDSDCAGQTYWYRVRKAVRRRLEGR